MISLLNKKRILEYLKNNQKRFDGRKPFEIRKIKFSENISKNAEGSVSVKVGNTEVYAGVKMTLVEPYPDSPDEGSMSVSVELSPMADEDFELGPPKIDAIEMARVVDRGIRESGFIDFKKLCIKEGEKCWQINLDIYAINNDGNLLDACSFAALAALCLAKMPKYNEKEEKIEKELTDMSLPLNKKLMPIMITFYKLGDVFIIDPAREEEEVADYRLSIAVSEKDGNLRINAMQKGKEGSVSIKEIEKILDSLEEIYKREYLKIKEKILGYG
ncbi:MAG: RNA-binding protein [Candidatus Pacearchaeota archaeon]